MDQFLKFYENKEHFIDKLPVGDLKKSEYKAFFKSHANLENKIDWQKKDKEEVCNSIEDLIQATNDKTNELSKGYWKKKGFDLLKEDENFLYLLVKSYEAAVFADSYNCGGQGATWCIGTSDDTSYWETYTSKKEDTFVMAYRKGSGPKDEKKYMLEIKPDLTIEVWDQLDDSHSIDEYLDIHFSKGECKKAKGIFDNLTNRLVSFDINSIDWGENGLIKIKEDNEMAFFYVKSDDAFNFIVQSKCGNTKGANCNWEIMDDYLRKNHIYILAIKKDPTVIYRKKYLLLMSYQQGIIKVYDIEGFKINTSAFNLERKDVSEIFSDLYASFVKEQTKLIDKVKELNIFNGGEVSITASIMNDFLMKVKKIDDNFQNNLMDSLIPTSIIIEDPQNLYEDFSRTKLPIIRLTFNNAVIDNPIYFNNKFCRSSIKEIDLSQIKYKVSNGSITVSFFNAFSYNNFLENVILPTFDIYANKLNLRNAFISCGNLKKIVMNGRAVVEDLNMDNAFNNCNLQEIVFPIIEVKEELSLNFAFENSEINILDLSNIIIKRETTNIMFYKTFSNTSVNKLVMPSTNVKKIKNLNIDTFDDFAYYNKINWNGFPKLL